MSYRKMIAGIHVALFGGPLFLVAGTLDWWRANGQKGTQVFLRPYLCEKSCVPFFLST
jgi:hypothetical protein